MSKQCQSDYNDGCDGPVIGEVWKCRNGNEDDVILLHYCVKCWDKYNEDIANAVARAWGLDTVTAEVDAGYGESAVGIRGGINQNIRSAITDPCDIDSDEVISETTEDNSATTIPGTFSDNTVDLIYHQGEACETTSRGGSMSTRFRTTNTKDGTGNPSASLLTSLSDSGFWLDIFSYSHKSDSPEKAHICQRQHVFVPRGCAIMFHEQMVHNGAEAQLVNGQVTEYFRLFEYLVSDDGMKPDLNVTKKVALCDNCEECVKHNTECNDEATESNELRNNMIKLRDKVSVGDGLVGNFADDGFCIFRSHEVPKDLSRMVDIDVNKNNAHWKNIQKSSDATVAKRFQLEIDDCSELKNDRDFQALRAQVYSSVETLCNRSFSIQSPSILRNEGNLLKQYCHTDY